MLAEAVTDIEDTARLLDAAPAELAGVLYALAVWQAPGPTALIRQLAGTVEELSDQELADGLARTGLLVGPPVTGAATLGPLHPTAVDVVLGGLGWMERTQLRRRAVELARQAGQPPEVLGRLLIHTNRIGTPWAVDTLRAAAEQARAGGDRPLAIELLRRALVEATEPTVRAQLLLSLGGLELASVPLGGVRRCAELLRYRGVGLTRARAAAADLLICAGAGDQSTAIAEAYHHTEPDDPAREVLHSLYWLPLDHRLAAANATPAVPPLPDQPAGPLRSAALAWLYATVGRDRGTARELARSMLANPQAASEDGALFAPAMAASRTLTLADDPAAVSALDELVVRARRSRVPVYATRALLDRADLLLRHGRFEDAWADLAETDALLPDAAALPVVAARRTALSALLDMECGRLDQAEMRLPGPGAEPLTATTAGVWLLYARGVLDVLTGRYRDAVTHLRECGHLLSAGRRMNPALCAWRSWAALAHHALDHPAAVTELFGQEISRAEAWGAPSAIGVAQLRTGLLLTGAAAVERLTEAAATLRDSPARPRRGEALVALAEYALRAGDPGIAVTALDELAGLDYAGPGRERAVLLRRRALSRPAPMDGTLSPAQWRVVELAAQGLTNTAVAAALSISKRGVELHLSNAYRRLGIAGRAELAAAVDRMEERR